MRNKRTFYWLEFLQALFVVGCLLATYLFAFCLFLISIVIRLTIPFLAVLGILYLLGYLS